MNIADSPVLGSNGNYYGLTMGGGANGLGVLFEYDYTGNNLNLRFDMTSAGGGMCVGNLC